MVNWVALTIAFIFQLPFALFHILLWLIGIGKIPRVSWIIVILSISNHLMIDYAHRFYFDTIGDEQVVWITTHLMGANVVSILWICIRECMRELYHK